MTVSSVSEVDDEDRLRDGWRHVPLASRLPADPSLVEKVIERHDRSLAQGLATYADPLSGFNVFTSEFLARRGDCCASGCRHCPFR